ncbi:MULTISPECIES: MurR/RpiR family transcriptional regulator [unclassified Luteimonas]|uniref:MurR/RpiR family transcriptional regulator n=1 Tax=unclassified Luteimonas TaxID=2629088 RepID=UPI0018F0FDF6|nr:MULTISPECIES: MurR/RpiR family transcriptional regulator [unclassified Luteimonas]MBJ6980363.1 MurR/RpiR family transcriptional regulator [Luteimonas sp. MC1572]MBJ7574364.1 MurR/RpiR family transcriptional regulator [Luteimonas sp. MC1828]QQO04248.1 MurR/RpiR family transcriptional regulator [Luteimonas sp. MC1572]
MPPLLRIRGERDRMSAIERRIADFMLENAHLLRDYSSQQLANALGISQSSVVKFSQKLGFKGYPDLKYSIGESLARHDGEDDGSGIEPGADIGDPYSALADTLWRAKSQAEQATRVLNPHERIDAVAAAIRGADKVYSVGLGHDGLNARAFAIKLALLGRTAIHLFDPSLMGIGTSSAAPGDVLLVFSEHGEEGALCHTARLFRARGGKVVTITRHTANALRASADVGLLVSAHDPRGHVELLLYQAALQHLLDLVFLLLCEDDAHLRRLVANFAESLQAPGT